MSIYLDGRTVKSGESAGFLNIQDPKDLAVLMYKAIDQNDAYAQLIANFLIALVDPQTPAFGYGETASRPTEPVNGQSYFDTNLGLPIWWTGSLWVDATGTDADI